MVDCPGCQKKITSYAPDFEGNFLTPGLKKIMEVMSVHLYAFLFSSY